MIVGTILNKLNDKSYATEQLVFRVADDQVVSTLQSEMEAFIAGVDEIEQPNEEFNFEENYYRGQLLEKSVNADGFVMDLFCW